MGSNFKSTYKFTRVYNNKKELINKEVPNDSTNMIFESYENPVENTYCPVCNSKLKWEGSQGNLEEYHCSKCNHYFYLNSKNILIDDDDLSEDDFNEPTNEGVSLDEKKGKKKKKRINNNIINKYLYVPSLPLPPIRHPGPHDNHHGPKPGPAPQLPQGNKPPKGPEGKPLDFAPAVPVGNPSGGPDSTNGPINVSVSMGEQLHRGKLHRGKLHRGRK